MSDWYDRMADFMLLVTFFSLILSFRSTGKDLSSIRWLLVVSVISDAALSISYYMYGITIPYIGTVYRILEFILLIEFYFIVFGKKIRSEAKWLIQLSVPFFVILILSYDSTPMRIVNSIFFSILSTLWFLKMIREMSVGVITNLPLFWVNSAILIYFSGSLFLFLLFEPLGKLHETSAIVSYMFHNLLGIIKNILFGIGFWKAIKLAKGQISLSYDG